MDLDVVCSMQVGDVPSFTQYFQRRTQGSNSEIAFIRFPQNLDTSDWRHVDPDCRDIHHSEGQVAWN